MNTNQKLLHSKNQKKTKKTNDQKIQNSPKKPTPKSLQGRQLTILKLNEN